MKNEGTGEREDRKTNFEPETRNFESLTANG